MCGQSAIASAFDSIPEGNRLIPVSEPRRVVTTTNKRAEAVAEHLATQAGTLAELWEFSDNTHERAALQAGLAATYAMADLLHACANGQFTDAEEAMALFINEAVDTGVVAA